MTNQKITILNLGWGVQSWTMAAMVALEELPPVTAAIHADTTHETTDTYDFAAEMTDWLQNRGINIITVTSPDAGNLTEPPWYSDAGGMLRRQCTNRWKIAPVRREISRQLADRSLSKTPGIVEQWLGITIDEAARMTASDVQYIKNRYPLIEKGMSRADCILWLKDNQLPVPGKSACVFCPYHSRGYWQEMKRRGGADWEKSIEIDQRARQVAPPSNVYAHPLRQPLPDAVSIPEDYGYHQPRLLKDDYKVGCDSAHCWT